MITAATATATAGAMGGHTSRYHQGLRPFSAAIRAYSRASNPGETSGAANSSSRSHTAAKPRQSAHSASGPCLFGPCSFGQIINSLKDKPLSHVGQPVAQRLIGPEQQRLDRGFRTA